MRWSRRICGIQIFRKRRKSTVITYTFNDTGKDSLYEYLYKCIKQDILHGVLQAGEKLPSKRSFAKNLGVSVITVENAYEQLVAEGYIYSLPKKGFYVNDVKHEVIQSAVQEDKAAAYQRRSELISVPEAAFGGSAESRRFAEFGRNAEFGKTAEFGMTAESEGSTGFGRPAELGRNAESEGIAEFGRNAESGRPAELGRNAEFGRNAESGESTGSGRAAEFTRNAEDRINSEFREPTGNKKREYLADFTSNQTLSELFPFTIWTKMIREVLGENQIQLMTNPPCGGIYPLREAIAGYLKDFRGMEVQPEQIIIGAGTEYLYGLLIQLLGQDLIYAVENPGYQKIARIYSSWQVPCEYITMDDAGVNVDELEQKNVDIVHISPSHHYPTGIVMPISRRYELLRWAAKDEKHYIIEDDYDSELRLGGQPIPTLQSIDVSNRVIYINTFTKTLASTVRISYMILPPPLLNRFYKTLSFYSCSVSNFEQYTLGKFIEEGYFEKHINRLRNHYHKKRDAILGAIKESRLNDLVKISGEEAGVHFLLEIKTDKEEEDFLAETRKQGILLSPLSAHFHNQETEQKNIYVMNYSSIQMSDAQEIVRRMELCV